MYKARQSLLVAALFFAAVFSATVVSSESHSSEPSAEQPANVQQSQAGIVDVIRTRQLEIYDAAGNAQVVIGTRQDGASGIFMPNPDTPLAFMGANLEGDPLILLQTPDGEVQSNFSINSKQRLASLRMDSGDGTVLVYSGLDSLGISSMRKGSSEEATLLIAPSIEPGVHLEMKDSNGRITKFP